MYKQLEAQHKQESIEVIDGIFSDNYKDFASNLIDVGSLKSTEELTIDNYGMDDALKTELDDLGPILNLPQIMEPKKADDFFSRIDVSNVKSKSLIQSKWSGLFPVLTNKNILCIHIM